MLELDNKTIESQPNSSESRESLECDSISNSGSGISLSLVEHEESLPNQINVVNKEKEIEKNPILALESDESQSFDDMKRGNKRRKVIINDDDDDDEGDRCCIFISIASFVLMSKYCYYLLFM